MKALPADKAFLALPEESFADYSQAKYVIQQVPYEHTSSYLEGSSKGPAAILSASHFVEFYDEELDCETFRNGGIATMEAMDFSNKVDEEAMQYIDDETNKLLKDGKFVISLGAEHTITNGFVRAHHRLYPHMAVLQIDAHSDLREAYNGNKYSHASVMKRVHDMQIPLVQIGIRAQCKEESDLIKSSTIINTFYAHQIRKNDNWMDQAIACLPKHVYLSIDADGFDPSIMPAVGTAEPNGIYWSETLTFLRRVFEEREIVGFDVLECAPMEGTILSEYTLAKLVYRLIGYHSIKK